MGNSKARLRRGLLLVTMLLVSVVLAFAAASCGSKEESGDIGNENASVLIVGGAPDASLGADGDICFDGTSQKLYVKSVGRWVETSYRSCAIEDNVLSVTYADGSVKRYALAADEPSEDCTHENLSEVFAVYPAKCVVPGIGVQSCLKCGESFSVIIPADGLSHELEGDHCTICGETVTFKTEANDDGGVTITGMNAVPENGNVEIPDEIAGKEVTVKAEAFKGEKEIKSVTVGSASIGDSAFEGCESLSSVTVGGASIGDSAFEGCKSLGSVTFKESMTETTIGDSAFKDCENLDNVSIPENVVSVGADAFAGTGYYKNTDNWKTISGIPSLLNNGKFLLKVDRSHAAATVALLDEPIGGGDYSVPEGTLVIADEAFAGVTGLSRVTLPAGVKTVGRDAFKGTDLQSVVLPAGIANYEGLKGLDLTIYFLGGEADWKYEDLSEGVYYRSDDLPEKSGKFWRYEDNVVTAWPNLERLELTEYTKEFLLNDTFSTGDLTVTAVYDDHTTETLGADDYTVDSSAVDMTKDGIYTVTVTHRYIEATYEITVKLHTYTVTVVYGNGDANETKSVTEGKDNYTLPAEPHKTGYAFLGWKVGDGEELKQADETVTITGDTTVTAQWQVKTPDVKLNLAGGTGVTYSVSELENDHYTVTLTGEPTYEKRRFTGWTVTVGGVDSEIVENEVNVPLADDMTVVITANWVELVTVTYRYNSTQAETSETVDINTSVTLPTPDHKTGYTFEAWYEGDTKLEGETYTVEKDVTLDAHWTAKTPSVSMNYSGGSAGSATYAVSALSEDETYTITVSGTPVYENYEFRGWTVTVNGVEQDSLPAEGGDVTVPLDDEMTVTVTAVWADLYTVTVTGDHAKATFGKAGPYPAGTEVSFTLEIDAGYKLGEVTGATLNGEGKYTLTVGEANVTVTVTTTPVEVKTQIIGIDNADEVKLNVEQVGAKATVTVEGTPYKMGHTFTHWTVKVGETDTAYADSLVLALENADVTVTYTANWTRNEPVVEIQLGGGEKGDVATAAIFEEDHYTITITGTPEFTKHSFVKWTATLNKEPVGVNENTITVPLADEMNVVITAVWADLYSVTATGDHISTDLEAADYHATGDTVEFTVTVENGYKLVSVMNGDETLNANEEGEYSVTVADQDIVITVTAVAVEVKVTVKDADVEPQIDQNGASATITVGTPQKTGYTFGGWTVTVDGQPEEYTDPLVLKLENSDVEVIFTASWQVIGLEIEEVYGDNADSSQVNIQSTLEGDHYTVTVSGEPTRAGYRFNGWTISGGAPATLGTDGGTITVPLAAEMKVTITAVWVEQVTVTFEFANGIQENHSETVDINSPVTLPEVTRKTGYDFEAWYEGDNKATVEGNSYTVTKTVTLTAHWTARKPKVTFDWGESFGAEQNGASQTTSELEGDHYTVTVTGRPTRAGYRFDGWTISGGTPDTLTTDGGKITVALTDEMTVTITAKWVQQFTVTFHFDNDDQQETSQTVDINTSVTLPAEGHKTGYTFEAWYEGETKLEGATYTVVKDVTLTAHWTALKPTVTFNYGGGSGDEGYDCSELEGDHYTITITSTHEFVGHEFTGWSVTVGDAQAIPVEEGGSFTVPLSDNMIVTITAVWNDLYTVTVTGDHVNATFEPAGPYTKDTEVKFSLTVDAGYKLVSVKNGDQPLEAQQDGEYTVTVESKNIEITVTTEQVVIKTNVVDGDGATLNVTRSENGAKATVTVEGEPKKTGYTFDKWTVTVDGESKDYAEQPTIDLGNEDVTVVYTASWTAKTPKIEFSFANGGAQGTAQADYGTLSEDGKYTITITGTPTYEGRTFDKWTATLNGQPVEVTDNKIVISLSDNMTVVITANWVEQFTVTYELGEHAAGDATAPASETVDVNSSVNLPAAPAAAEGYEFAGWQVGSDAANLKQPNDSITVTADVTVTAQWKAYYTLTIEGTTENITVEITEGRSDNGRYYENSVIKFKVNVEKGKYDISEVNASDGCLLEGPTDGVYTLTFGTSDVTLTVTTKELHEVKLTGTNLDQVTLRYEKEGENHPYYYEGDTVNLTIEVNSGYTLVKAVVVGAVSGSSNISGNSVEITFGVDDVTIQVDVRKTHDVTFVVTGADTSVVNLEFSNSTPIAEMQATVAEGVEYSLIVSLTEGNNEKYTIKSVTSSDVELSEQDGQYTFTVGTEDITITITVEAIEETQYNVTLKYEGLDLDDNGENVVSVEITTDNDDKLTLNANATVTLSINKDYENKYAFASVEANPQGGIFTEEQTVYTFTVEGDITLTITLDRLYEVKVVTVGDAKISYTLNVGDDSVKNSGVVGYYKEGTSIDLSGIRVGAEGEHYTYTVEITGISDTFDPNPESYSFSVGTSDITITITAVKLYQVKVVTDGDAQATYTLTPNGVDANEEGYYPSGTTLTLNEIKVEGDYTVTVSSEDVDLSSGSVQDGYTFTVGETDITITITAKQNEYKITVKYVGLDEGDNGEDIVDLTLYPEDGFTTDTDVLFEVNINALYENKYSINTVSATGCKNFDYEGGSFTVGTEDITITITLDRLYHVEVVTDTDAGIIYDLNPVDVDVTKSEEGYYKSGTNLKVENIMSEYTVTVTSEDVVLSGSVDEGYPFTVGTKDITIEIRFVRHTLTIEGDKDNVDIDYTRDVNNGEAEGPYLEGETVLIAITAKDGFTVKSVVIADVEEGDNGYSDLGDYNYIITMKADVTITITTEAVQVTPKYTVQFVAEGATSKPENVEVEGDGTVDLTGKTAEKENYKFLYWYYLDADGEEYKVEETIKPSELVTSDNDGNDTTLTLHAKWVQLFTVTLTVNEESLKGNVELSQNDSVLDLSEGSVQVEKGEITLTVTPVDGYEYTVTVKGESLSPNDDAGDEYTITVEEDTDITVAFTKTAVPEVTEVTLDFTKNFDTYASVWDNSYAQHTIQFTAVGEQNIKGEVAFSGAAKQTDINNMPVVRPDSSTEYVEISLTDRKISSFEFTLKEWSSSKTFTDIHLEYWDGTSWKTCSDVFEGRIGTSTEITTRTIQSEEGLTGVSKVRISITGSGKQQLGIQLAKIVFEKPLSSEDQAKVNQALAEIEDLGSLEASVNSIPTLQTDSATEGITYAWSVSSETELCKVENNEITIDEFPTTDQKVSLKVKILLNGSVVGSATVELTIKGHEHSYVYEDRDENTHSVSCSVCGKELDPEAHEYDNGTDATCNKCNHERDISNLQGSYTITTTNNTIKNFAATYNSYNWEASDANGTISGKLYGYKNGENIQYNNGKSASFMISSEATVVPISKITITTTTSVKWQVFVSNSPCATDVKTGSGSPTGTSFDLTSGSSGTSVDVSSAAGTYFAIVYKGSGAIYVKSIVIEYKTVTDEEKVQSVAKGYELPAENKTYTEVKEYNLPTETEGGVTITWALTGTSDYCSIVDDTKLNVTSLPEKDAEVSLTATFHLNGKTATNTYTVTIKAKSGGGDVTGQTVYKKVTSDGDLQEGKKIVFAYVKSNDPTKNVVSGGLNGSYLDKVTGVEFAETYTIITDIKSAVTWTLQKSGDYWEFINQDGKKLGETSAKNLSITSGKTEWSISVTSSSTHVQNVSSKNYLCYNASSPRFTTYTSIQAEMLIFIETTV